MTPTGLPHSEISGSMLYSSSPKLIAGIRVLHRLLIPRHPPTALTSLTKNLLSCDSGQYFFSPFIRRIVLQAPIFISDDLNLRF